MKLLIDMNLSPLWVRFLAEHGIASVHWSEIGEASAPDDQIFDYAGANGFAVFTHDLDFGTLLAHRKWRRPSVIQIRAQDVLPTRIGEMVIRSLGACQSQLEEGTIVTVDPQ